MFSFGGEEKFGIGLGSPSSRDRTSIDEERRATYKQGINPDSARKHRREKSEKIRKDKKDILMKKKRGILEEELTEKEVYGAIMYYLENKNDRVAATAGITTYAIVQNH